MTLGSHHDTLVAPAFKLCQGEGEGRLLGLGDHGFVVFQ